MYISKHNKNLHHTIFYVYKTTCIITNQYYIGIHKTKNINDGYLGSGKYILESIKKYGVDNHTKEILCYCDNYTELLINERNLITKEVIKDPLCMNIKIGGTGGYNHITGDKIKEISNYAGECFSKKIKTDDNFRKEFSEKVKLGMQRAKEKGYINKGNKGGRITTLATKEKISKANKGNQTGINNSQYNTCWIYSLIENCNKKIKKTELDNYLEQGWIRGMNKNFTKIP